MANKIQIKRGIKSNLPALSVGEPAFCTDTEELYIGGNSGNVKISQSGDMAKSVYDTDNDGVVDNASALQGHDASYFETPSGAQAKIDALAGEGNTATVKAVDDALKSHLSENAAHTSGWFNAKEYGAIGNGIVDDTNAIKAVFAAGAHSVVFIPNGTYMMYDTVEIEASTTVVCGGLCVFNGVNCNSDAFRLKNGDWQTSLHFGVICNYINGAAIHAMPNANLVDVHFQSIINCMDGLLLDAGNKQLLDDNWTGTYINDCTNAIRLYASATNVGVQGHIFNINFIVRALHSIYFDAPIDISPLWGANVFNCYEVDANHKVGSTGITSSNNNAISNNVFNCTGFFGAFESWYVKVSNSNKLELSIPPQYILTAENFAIKGNGNKVSINPCEANFLGAYIEASMTSNNLANFNGGNPIRSNTVHLSFTTTTELTAGQTLDIYAFHVLAQGYGARIYVTPRWNVPLLIMTAEDETTYTGTDNERVTNQIHIRMYAVGVIPVGTYKLALTLE